MTEKTNRIYVVEDDDNIRELVVYALESAGFGAIGLSDGKMLREAVREAKPELVILDIMMPGEDGLSLLKWLKSSPETEGISTIMLTAKDAEYDRIHGLDSGADDYISKPFSVMEVIARVRAVLRRSAGTGADGSDKSEDVGKIYQSSDVILNTGRREVTAGDVQTELTYKEFELLACLMKNAGIVMSRDRILEQVWGYDYTGETRTVDMHIKSLRKKLGEDRDIIKTVRNVGYKLD